MSCMGVDDGVMSSTANRSFRAEKKIEAEPGHVWDTLMQTDTWTDWDSGLERVEGTLGAGQRLVLHVRGQSRPFKLRVTTWSRPETLQLSGGMPLGLFTGTRTYRLRGEGSGTVFEMEERFTGPLAPLIGRSIPDLQPSFDAFVAGLRRAAESTAHNGPKGATA